MKKIIVLFLLSGLLAGCEYDASQTLNYSVNEPVFISREEFRNSIKVTQESRPLSDFGKMCFYKGYLYISEPGKGIHIINNTNPSNPQITGYIQVAGNYDLTIRNDLLYADAFIDLLWFDISNPARPALKGRSENIFPEAFPTGDNEYGYDYGLCYEGVSQGKVVVGWELTERTEKISYGRGEGLYDASPTQSITLNSGGNGTTGSMSRFSLYDQYLYAVINNQMSIVDLSGETPRKAIDNIYIGGNVETIFSYKDKMFMGTPFGLLIYSVEEPLNPSYCSQIQHVYGCDPVVVEDDLAYVTIHSGNLCGQNFNELIVIDVSDIYQPTQIVSYSMYNPKGLGIDKETLFLCDEGLKIFKITDPQTLISNKLAHYTGMDGYDVIPFDNTLMMISDKGLYQYDYTDINKINPLSVIPVKK
jgi:hypothetical protein